MTTFSTKDILKQASVAMGNHRGKKMWQYFLLSTVLWVVAYLVFGRGAFISSIFVVYALTVWALSIVDTGDFSFGTLFDRLTLKQFVYFILALFAATWLTMLGFILVIVPGIILLVHFIFVPYIALEKSLSPLQILKESRRLTKGNRWKIFWFLVVSLLINLLGLICLGIGILYTMPLTSLAQAMLYRKLSQ